MQNGEEWYLAEPPGWVPVPVAAAAEVLDRRVILAAPPGAFRPDMRAVSPLYQREDSGWVDVVSEHDWYRSRIRAEPVPTSPYPADRVWVEQRTTTAPGTPDDDPEWATVLGQLNPTDPPPRRTPRRARDVADLTGRRLVVAQPDGPVFHRRAVSEPHQDSAGDIEVTICSEYDWYRWSITREPPRAQRFPIYLLWVE